MDAAAHLAQVVRAIVTLRADQNRMFGHPLSAQAWDLIFVLYLAQLEGRPVRDRDAAFMAGIDAEAGRRWIAYLLGADVLARCPGDAGDCVALSDTATARIEAFVGRAQEALAPR